jgi:cytochrome c peroxidase
MKKWLGWTLVLTMAWACNCGDDAMKPVGGDLESLPYDPQAYPLAIPKNFPPMQIPADNPLTEAGVALGRKLFWDPILSRDSSMSCASCHLPQFSLTDGKAVSTGVDGVAGTRSSMSLLNVGFGNDGFFWDGRISTLEEQALIPVEDPIELHHSWPEVEKKLRSHPSYPAEFRAAFGIKDRKEITKALAAKALAQFERTLISGNSKYDRFLRGELFLDDDEEVGRQLYFDLPDNLPDAECGHCHNDPLFTTNTYFNNGITPTDADLNFPDLGRGKVTGLKIDRGKFKTPTLRNIEFSAPYMHDGRFKTLEEVIEHYNSGGHPAVNKDSNVRKLNLTNEQKRQLLAFIKTLRDTTFLNNPAFKSPFK